MDSALLKECRDLTAKKKAANSEEHWKNFGHPAGNELIMTCGGQFELDRFITAHLPVLLRALALVGSERLTIMLLERTHYRLSLDPRTLFAKYEDDILSEEDFIGAGLVVYDWLTKQGFKVGLEIREKAASWPPKTSFIERVRNFFDLNQGCSYAHELWLTASWALEKNTDDCN